MLARPALLGDLPIQLVFVKLIPAQRSKSQPQSRDPFLPLLFAAIQVRLQMVSGT